MSGSNTSLRNTTYINGGITYVVKSNDDNINVNSALGATLIYIPNINNDKNFTRKININDTGDLAGTYPITVACVGGNLINGQSSINLSINGISAEILIVNNNEYLANLSSDDSSPPSGAVWGSITGNPVNQSDLQDGTLQGPFVPSSGAITTGDTFKEAFQKVQGSLNGNWKLGGNVLSFVPSQMGSLDGTDWGLIRGSVEFITMASVGPTFKNAFGQPFTGAFFYLQNAGRIALVADNGSTSGGAGFVVYGSSGGTTVGAPYLDGSFSIRLLISGFGVADSFLLNKSGNLLLGTTTGSPPTARIDLRLFSSSDANTAFSITNSSASQLLKVTEAGNFGFNGSSFGGGIKCMFLGNATTIPTSNPVGGGILYVEGGDLKYRGPSGTITTLAVS